MVSTRPGTPSADARRTALPKPKPLRTGLEAWLSAIQGRWKGRKSVLARWAAEADDVLRLHSEAVKLSSHQLRTKLQETREQFLRHPKQTREQFKEAMALVVEAANREVGLMPYREQVMGAIGLTEGYLVEMATGEGKTLTLGLAATICAWAGRPVHIVTANDYLASRDTQTMRPLYYAAGLEVMAVTTNLETTDRRTAYGADIVYTTSKELVADFLRDRLALGQMADAARRQLRLVLRPGLLDKSSVVQRGLHTVLVDEADYILIDEAVTPLLISRPKEHKMLKAATHVAYDVAESFRLGEDYEVDKRFSEVDLKEEALQRLDNENLDNIPVLKNKRWRQELLEQALRAREFHLKGKNYVIKDDKIVIVDEGTGRLMPNRSWRMGLHQAVECKEGLQLTDPAETIAGLSFQRFFRFIPRLAGVTGTARENRGELWRIYGLPLMTIPTHRPTQRSYAKPTVYPDLYEKWEAVCSEIVRLHEEKKPVLVGTRSVSASESLAEVLRGHGLHFQLLNAVHHDREAAIVAGAGEPDSITIATNMAGRGTDIRLAKGIAERGGLVVIATEYHESARVDRQLYGRCARQGDPGFVYHFASLEDDVVTRFVPGWLRKGLANALRKKLPLAQPLANAACRYAQKTATKHNFKGRLSVLRQDKWLSESLSFAGGPRGL